MGVVRGDGRRGELSSKLSSKTVLVDPTAFLEDWKRQIKGKVNIPANQQRLTFPSSCVRKQQLDWTCWNQSNNWQILADSTLDEILKDLQSWHAILHIDDQYVKLLCPLVLLEEDKSSSRLYSRAAEELRQAGVPCNVFYLLFDKWISSSWIGGDKELREINIQVDNDFQRKRFHIELYGKLNGEDLPFPFSFDISGRELAAKLSMLEQMMQYRQGQKMQHQLVVPLLNESKVNDLQQNQEKEESSTDVHSSSLGADNFFLHCGKDREFTAIISSEFHQLRCIVLTVITIPLDALGCLNEPTCTKCAKMLKGKNGKSQSETSAGSRSGKVHTSLSSKGKKIGCTCTPVDCNCHCEHDLLNKSGLDAVNCVSMASLATEHPEKESKKKKRRKKKSRKHRKENKSIITAMSTDQILRDKEIAQEQKFSEEVFDGSLKVCIDSRPITEERRSETIPFKGEKDNYKPMQVYGSQLAGEGILSAVGHTDTEEICRTPCTSFHEVDKQSGTVTVEDDDLLPMNISQEASLRATKLSITDSSFSVSDAVSDSLDNTCNSIFACTSEKEGFYDDEKNGNRETISEIASDIDFNNSGLHKFSGAAGIRRDFINALNITDGHSDANYESSYLLPELDHERGKSINNVCTDATSTDSKYKGPGIQCSTIMDLQNHGTPTRNVAGKDGLRSKLVGYPMYHHIPENGIAQMFNASGNVNVHNSQKKLNDHQLNKQLRDVNSLVVESGVTPVTSMHNHKGKSTVSAFPPPWRVQTGSLRYNGKGQLQTTLEKCQNCLVQNNAVGQGYNEFFTRPSKWHCYPDYCLPPNQQAGLEVGNEFNVNIGKGFLTRKKVGGYSQIIQNRASQMHLHNIGFMNDDNRPLQQTLYQQKNDLQKVGESGLRYVLAVSHHQEDILLSASDTLATGKIRPPVMPAKLDSPPRKFKSNYYTIGEENGKFAGFQSRDEEVFLRSRSVSGLEFEKQHTGWQKERDGEHNYSLELLDYQNVHDNVGGGCGKELNRLHSDAIIDIVDKKNIEMFEFQSALPTADRQASTSIHCGKRVAVNINTETTMDHNNELASEASGACNTTMEKMAEYSIKWSDVDLIPPSLRNSLSSRLKLHYHERDASSQLVQNSDSADQPKRRIQYPSQDSDCFIVADFTEPLQRQLRALAHEVLKAVHASCEYKYFLGNLPDTVHSSLAEFEKFLQAVAPEFEVPQDNFGCMLERESSIRNGMAKMCSHSNTHFVCRCRFSDVLLKTVWQWYLEPSCYGLQVKTADFQQSHMTSDFNSGFQAFFVPYLSGMQLFGYSVGVMAGNISSDHSQNYSGELCEACCCELTGKTWESQDIHLLYEFFDGGKPQERRPFFDMIRELMKGDSYPYAHSSGDPSVLDRLRLGDLHPASWFSVAWYPIYRIPDRTFRATFLTYHSLNHFFCTCMLSHSLHGNAGFCMNKITSPVVGLMSYNALESRFLLSQPHDGLQQMKFKLPPQVLQQHRRRLEETAATMARGTGNESSTHQSYKHFDYRFFLSRSR